MANESRLKLYKGLQTAGYNIGSYADFDRKMNNAESRRKFYDGVTRTRRFNLGDWNTFESKIKGSKYHAMVNGKRVQVSEAEYKELDRRQKAKTNNGNANVTNENWRKVVGNAGFDVSGTTIAPKKAKHADLMGLPQNPHFHSPSETLTKGFIAQEQEYKEYQKKALQWKVDGAVKRRDQLEQEIKDLKSKELEAIPSVAHAFNLNGKYSDNVKQIKAKQDEVDKLNAFIFNNTKGQRETITRNMTDLTKSVYDEIGKLQDKAKENGKYDLAITGGKTYRTELFGHDKVDWDNYQTTARILDDAQKIVDESNREGRGQGRFMSALNGLKNSTINATTWSQGYSDLFKNIQIKNIADKYANPQQGGSAEDTENTFTGAVAKLKKGQNISSSEEALLKAVLIGTLVESTYGKNINSWYKAGVTTGEAFPYMVEMFINPLANASKTATSVVGRFFTKQGAKGLSRWLVGSAVKEGTKEAVKSTVKSRAKAYMTDLIGKSIRGTILGTDKLVRGAGMAVTTGAAKTGAETIERMNGELRPVIDENGNVQYGGRKEGTQEGLGEAFIKSLGDQTLEYATEMGFGPVKSVVKGMKHAVAPVFTSLSEKAVPLLSKLTGNKIYTGLASWAHTFTPSKMVNFVNNFEKQTKWHGTFEEYWEEVEGNTSKALLGISNQNFSLDPNSKEYKDSIFNFDQNVETFLGVALMGGSISAVKTMGYRSAMDYADKQLADCEASGKKVFGADAWNYLKDELDALKVDKKTKYNEQGVSEVTKYIIEKMKQGEFTKEGEKAVFDYLHAREFKQGVIEGTKNTNKELDDAEAHGVKEELEQGNQPQTPEEVHNIGAKLNADEDALLQLPNGQRIKELIDRMVEDGASTGELNSIRDGLTDKENAAVDAYLESKTNYQKVQNQVDDKVQDAFQKESDFVSKGTDAAGNVTFATKDGQRVIITANDGNNATFITEDGSRGMCAVSDLDVAEGSETPFTTYNAEEYLDNYEQRQHEDISSQYEGQLNHNPKTVTDIQLGTTLTFGAQNSNADETKANENKEIEGELDEYWNTVKSTINPYVSNGRVLYARMAGEDYIVTAKKTGENNELTLDLISADGSTQYSDIPISDIDKENNATGYAYGTWGVNDFLTHVTNRKREELNKKYGVSENGTSEEGTDVRFKDNGTQYQVIGQNEQTGVFDVAPLIPTEVDGKIQYVEDFDNVLHMTADQLIEAQDGFYDADLANNEEESEHEGEAFEEEEVETPTEEEPIEEQPTEEEPTEEQTIGETPQSNITEDEEGEPVFDNASEDEIADWYDKNLGKDGGQFIQQNLDLANETLDAVNNEEPKEGKGAPKLSDYVGKPNAYRKAKAEYDAKQEEAKGEWQKKKDAATADVNRWKNIQNKYIAKQADNAQDANALAIFNNEKATNDAKEQALGDPQSLDEYIAREAYKYRYLWKNKEDGTRGLAAHLFGKDDAGERAKRLAYLSNSNGVTPEEAAHDIAQHARETGFFGQDIDETDVFNTLLDVLRSNNNRGEVLNAIAEDRQRMQEEEERAQQEEEERRNAADRKERDMRATDSDIIANDAESGRLDESTVTDRLREEDENRYDEEENALANDVKNGRLDDTSANDAITNAEESHTPQEEEAKVTADMLSNPSSIAELPDGDYDVEGTDFIYHSKSRGDEHCHLVVSKSTKDGVSRIVFRFYHKERDNYTSGSLNINADALRGYGVDDNWNETIENLLEDSNNPYIGVMVIRISNGTMAIEGRVVADESKPLEGFQGSYALKADAPIELTDRNRWMAKEEEEGTRVETPQQTVDRLVSKHPMLKVDVPEGTSIDKDGYVTGLNENDEVSNTLYHGTQADIKSVKDLKSGMKRADGDKANFNGDGISFTPSKSVALDYANGDEEHVLEGRVKLSKPYYTHGVAFGSNDEGAKESKQFADALKALGYDGIINLNSIDKSTASEVIVFDSKSIEEPKAEATEAQPNTAVKKGEKDDERIAKVKRNGKNVDVPYNKLTLDDIANIDDLVVRHDAVYAMEQEYGVNGAIDKWRKVMDEQNKPFEQYVNEHIKVGDMFVSTSGNTITITANNEDENVIKAEQLTYDGRENKTIYKVTFGRMIKDGTWKAAVKGDGFFGQPRILDAERSKSFEAPKETPKKSAPKVKKETHRLVSDEQMAELAQELMRRLGGLKEANNLGEIDDSILSIGLKLTVGIVERGTTKFVDYASQMVSTIGDVVRPYLKAFYNGVRDMPQAIENGLSEQMDDYMTVSKVNVATFDKDNAHVDIVETAEVMADEQKVTKRVKGPKVKKEAESAMGDLFAQNLSKPVEGVTKPSPKKETKPAYKKIPNYHAEGYDKLPVSPNGYRSGDTFVDKKGNFVTLARYEDGVNGFSGLTWTHDKDGNIITNGQIKDAELAEKVEKGQLKPVNAGDYEAAKKAHDDAVALGTDKGISKNNIVENADDGKLKFGGLTSRQLYSAYREHSGGATQHRFTIVKSGDKYYAFDEDADYLIKNNNLKPIKAYDRFKSAVEFSQEEYDAISSQLLSNRKVFGLLDVKDILKEREEKESSAEKPKEEANWRYSVNVGKGGATLHREKVMSNGIPVGDGRFEIHGKDADELLAIIEKNMPEILDSKTEKFKSLRGEIEFKRNQYNERKQKEAPKQEGPTYQHGDTWENDKFVLRVLYEDDKHVVYDNESKEENMFGIHSSFMHTFHKNNKKGQSFADMLEKEGFKHIGITADNDKTYTPIKEEKKDAEETKSAEKAETEEKTPKTSHFDHEKGTIINLPEGVRSQGITQDSFYRDPFHKQAFLNVDGKSEAIKMEMYTDVERDKNYNPIKKDGRYVVNTQYCNESYSVNLKNEEQAKKAQELGLEVEGEWNGFAPKWIELDTLEDALELYRTLNGTKKVEAPKVESKYKVGDRVFYKNVELEIEGINDDGTLRLKGNAIGMDLNMMNADPNKVREAGSDESIDFYYKTFKEHLAGLRKEGKWSDKLSKEAIEEIEKQIDEFDLKKVIKSAAEAEKGARLLGMHKAFLEDIGEKEPEDVTLQTKTAEQKEEPKKAEDAQPNTAVNEGARYSIEDRQYTTKKTGKTLDMNLVKFEDELSEEQKKSAYAVVKEDKGWYDQSEGGYMMRSEESAENLVNAVLGENAENVAEHTENEGETEENSVTLQRDEASVKFSREIAADMLVAVNTGERPYNSINDLRKKARECGMNVDESGADDILLQELVEDGLVTAARDLVASRPQDGIKSKAMFDAVCSLYDMQPNINRRSSNRIKMQQYSTPLPMGFVADMFANSSKVKSILEPTAGNGMLVAFIDPKKVYANELDKKRLANLREQGFAKVTDQDATRPFEGEYDAVIMNPPFGNAEAKSYEGTMISGLDPQIVLNTLSNMKDDGKASIIIGGNLEYATNGGIKSKRDFFAYLYDHYNVKGIIDMDGDLYKKQGTTYPTMMILIDGRRSAEERAQFVCYPPIKSNACGKVSTFEELYDKVTEIINDKRKTDGTELVRSQQGQLVFDTERDSDGGGDEQSDNRQHSTNDAERGGQAVSATPSNGNTGVLRETGQTRPDGRPSRRNGGNGNQSRNGRGRTNDVDSVPSMGVRGERDGLEKKFDTPKENIVQAKIEKPKVGEGEQRRLDQEKMPYKHHSKAFSLESVAPSSMVEAMDKNLAEIEKKYGSVDEFVTKELEYDSVEQAHNALAAEQMDSVAMAIVQMKKGKALIIGDQTGVGKGRQMAALIRWACKQGKKPIFITQKATLFSDIYRDLVDVGSGELKPFFFNAPTGENKGIMQDNKGIVVYKALPKEQQDKIFATGKLPDEYDYAVLTYSQVNSGDSVAIEEYNNAQKSSNEDDSQGKKGWGKKKSKAIENGKDTKKATFLRAIAADNYMFLDESHTASGGDSNTGIYFQSIIKTVKACTFASATFAKRPDTMGLYSLRTAMSEANITPSELIKVIEKGGVTLQEIMSRALTDAGQMVRRERDMQDVVTNWVTIDDPDTIKFARENYDKTIEVFNDIVDFQKTYIDPNIEELNASLAIQMKQAQKKKGTDKMGVANVPFASKAYAYTKQLMLALKAKAIADTVEKEIKAGRHPVIALESTMEANIKEFNDGDIVETPTFAASMLRGLASTLKYTVKEGKKEYHYFYKLSQLGADAEKAYHDLEKKIKEKTSDVFISPLDAIINELNKRGFSVGELTGRKMCVDVQDDGKAVVHKRTDTDKNDLMRRFNRGDLDVLILNKSASTGISLHASNKFADQRQRTMIIAQPLSDINDYMQMIGRIDRTGQVHRGYYINLGLPVPAEARFLMMLSTKLKSLNANTTTAQDSESNDVDAPDLLNKYGSRVVIEYLRDHVDIYDKLGNPLKFKLDDGSYQEQLERYNADEDDARKITGYVALLSTKEQQEFYDDVVQRYTDLINYLNDTGENDLKITVMPLRAKTIVKKVSSHGKDPNGDNPFAKDAYVEKVEMDVLRKPMKASEVQGLISSLNNGKTDNAAIYDLQDKVVADGDAKIDAENERYEKARTKFEESFAKVEKRINANMKMSPEQKTEEINRQRVEMQNKLDEKHESNLAAIRRNTENFKHLIRYFNVGGTYLMPNTLDNAVFQSTSPAIFCGIKAKDKMTPSTTFAVFAILDGRRKIELPLSQGGPLEIIRRTTGENYDRAQDTDLSNWDSQIPNTSRKEGYIMTGNILQAVADTQDKESGAYVGQLISYTDEEGNIHDGILMPDNWTASNLKGAGKPISTAMKDILDGLIVRSIDGKVSVRNIDRWSVRLTVPKTSKQGAKYFKNDAILKLTERGEFNERSGEFFADVDKDNLRDMLRILDNLGVRVETEEEGDNVRFRRPSFVASNGLSVYGSPKTKAMNDYYYLALEDIATNPTLFNMRMRVKRAAADAYKRFTGRKGGGRKAYEAIYAPVTEWRSVAEESGIAEDMQFGKWNFDVEDAKELWKMIEKPLRDYREELVANSYSQSKRFTQVYQTAIDEVDYAIKYYEAMANGVDVFDEGWETPRFKKNPVFVSNAESAVKNIQQNKASGEQWLNMLKKNGGLKAEEDKWLGISDFLNGKKSVTKDELLQYIAENQLEVQDVEYGEGIGSKEFNHYKQIEKFFRTHDIKDYAPNPRDIRNIRKITINGKEIEGAYIILDWNLKEYVYVYNNRIVNSRDEMFKLLKDENKLNTHDINGTRLSYTIDGLENKHEIALVVPNIEAYNQGDGVHFGDAGEGRAVAWVRFGDYTDADGKKVLVIDEIQSKRHQDGREKGYGKGIQPSEIDFDEYEFLYNGNSVGYLSEDQYGNLVINISHHGAQRVPSGTIEGAKEVIAKELSRDNAGVPDAPFQKTWHELAMKRMLRYAAENGYDKIAWTDGDTQAARYDLGRIVDHIYYINNNGGIQVSVVSDGDAIFEQWYEKDQESELAQVVGKAIASEIFAHKDEPAGYDGKIEGNGLIIGSSEGMKGFYDQMLPRFMNKYGKKWGIKVSAEHLDGLSDGASGYNVDGGLDMWTIPVTEEMKESVMNGQAMFARAWHGSAADFDRFNLDFALTGEGSQVNGTGVYVGSLRGTGERYAKIASEVNAKKTPEESEVEDRAYDSNSNLSWEAKWDNARQELIDNARQELDRAKKYADSEEDYKDEQERYNKMLATRKYGEFGGTLYEVEIPDDNGNNYLDWNRHYTMAETNAILEQIGDDNIDLEGVKVGEENGEYYATGESIYERVVWSHTGNAREASAYLHNVGFVGNKVPTGFNSGNAYRYNNDYNYVIFNPDDVKIVSKTAFKAGEILNRTHTSTELDDMERQTRELADTLHAPVRILRSEAEVDALKGLSTGNKETLKREGKGYYNTATGEVVIYLPNNEDANDAMTSILHEIVGHKNLRRMVGDKEYNRFLAKVYQGMSKETRSKINARAINEFGADVYEATDEYLAEMAEKDENPSLWRKVVSALREMLRSIGINLKLTENDAKYLVWQSKHQLTRGDIVTEAESRVMRSRLGINRKVGTRNAERTDINGVRFRKVDDPKVIEWFNKQPKTVTYKTVDVQEDGMHAPMADNITPANSTAKAKYTKTGNYSFGDVLEAEENPQQIVKHITRNVPMPDGTKKRVTYGKVNIIRGDGNPTEVAYDPYDHSSDMFINDQFKSAWERDTLRVIRQEIATSEIDGTDTYWADDAQLPTGKHEWKTGVVGQQLPPEDTRHVYMVRYSRPLGYVDWKEVADQWIDVCTRNNIAVPFNVVPKAIRDIIADAGVNIVEPERIMGKNCFGAYEEWKNGRNNPSPNGGGNTPTKGNVMRGRIQTPSEVRAEINGVLGQLANKVKDYVSGKMAEYTYKKTIGEFEKKLSPIVENKIFGIGVTKKELIDFGYDEESANRLINLVKIGFGGCYDDVMKKVIIFAQPSYKKDSVALLDMYSHENFHAYIDKMRDTYGRNYIDNMLRDLYEDEDLRALNQKIYDALQSKDDNGDYYYNEYERPEEYLTYIVSTSFARNKIAEKMNELPEEVRDIIQSYLNTLNKDYGERTGQTAANMRKGNTELPSKEGNVREEGRRVRKGRILDTLSDGTSIVEKQSGSARDQYERTLNNAGYKFFEAWQDSMLGLKELMNSVMKAEGKTFDDVADWENAYFAENHMSSINEKEFKVYRRDFFKPMVEAVKKLLDAGADYDDVKQYLVSKHGLERNEVFAQRDAERVAKEIVDYDRRLRKLDQARAAGEMDEDEYADKAGALEAEFEEEYVPRYEKNREKDYSGLTALYREDANEKDYSGFTAIYREDANETVADLEKKAEKYVKDFEGKYTTTLTDDLWNKIDACNKATLDKQLECGLIDQVNYDKMRSQFEHYIPLRGFDETTSDEVYDYLVHSQSPMNEPIKKANGRTSLADDPIATIGNMAESGIMAGNRNTMKQKFLNFVENHKSDAVSIDEVYLHKISTPTGDKWEIIGPEYTKDMSAARMENVREEWMNWFREQKKNNPDDYATGKEKPNIPFRVLNQFGGEHIVIVKRGGAPRTITINGNPRAAQALNGLTNPDAVRGLPKVLTTMTNIMARLNTTFSPAFVFANLSRDGMYANSLVWAKESPSYAATFNKNWGISMAKVFGLIRKFNKGTLDMDKPIEKLFYEFMMNGGETGQTRLTNVEQYKGVMQDTIDEMRRRPWNPKQLTTLLSAALEITNEWAEDTSRFAAYMTSRQQGRSIVRSVHDAKEISVNFNKKGAGGSTSGRWEEGNRIHYVSSQLAQLVRPWFMFFNAGVQGMNNVGRIAKKNKGKFTMIAAMYFGLGMLAPYIAAACGGDDGDDDYWNLPEYVRRQNLCLFVGTGYVKIPLPIELRAIYGLGDITMGQILKKTHYSVGELAGHVGEQITQILPIDFMGEGGMSLVPSVARPLTEAYITNKDWTGMPIYKDYDYLKNQPEWTKAYTKTDPAIIALCEWMNDISGGNKYKKGTIDLNPAIMEHLYRGYLGGMYTFLSQSKRTIFDQLLGAEELNVRNVPIVNRFYAHADERMPRKRIDAEWYENKAKMEAFESEFRGFKKDLESIDIVERSEALSECNRLIRSDEYARYEKWTELSNNIKALNDSNFDGSLDEIIYEMKEDANKMMRGEE